MITTFVYIFQYKVLISIVWHKLIFIHSINLLILSEQLIISDTVVAQMIHRSKQDKQTSHFYRVYILMGGHKERANVNHYENNILLVLMSYTLSCRCLCHTGG
jgi:hypothetical protein